MKIFTPHPQPAFSTPFLFLGFRKLTLPRWKPKCHVRHVCSFWSGKRPFLTRDVISEQIHFCMLGVLFILFIRFFYLCPILFSTPRSSRSCNKLSASTGIVGGGVATCHSCRRGLKERDQKATTSFDSEDSSGKTGFQFMWNILLYRSSWRRPPLSRSALPIERFTKQFGRGNAVYLRPFQTTPNMSFGTAPSSDTPKITTTRTTKTSARTNNEALEAIKMAGMARLDHAARDVASKTRKRLLLSDEDDGPSVDQLREANRLQTVLDESLRHFARRDDAFSIEGDPIVILDVEVSPDLRHARVYWALPYSLMGLSDSVASKLTDSMQARLDEKGGRLQALVHARLRSYYPPKLRFVPSDDSVMKEAIRNLFRGG